MSFRVQVMLAVMIYGILVYLALRIRRLPTTLTQQRMRSTLLRMAALYPTFFIVLSVIHMLLPQRSGLLALTQAIAPLLFLPLILTLPFVFIHKARFLRGLLLVCFAYGVIRFSPPLNFSLSSDVPTPSRFKVLQWNVNVCCGAEVQTSRVRPVLAASDADIIVLQEAYWEWIRTDSVISSRYPYQLNHTPEASTGIVVLSRYPILEGAGAERQSGVRGWPRIVWVRLDLGNQQKLLVIAGHTESPYSSNGQCVFPLCYNTSERDALIPRIRTIVDPALQEHDHILVIGDMNTTEREPAYHELARNLGDTQREVGTGFGNTWGLIPEIGWAIPLLRIEYLFHSANIKPLSVTTDCTLRGSDHCILTGAFTFK